MTLGIILTYSRAYFGELSHPFFGVTAISVGIYTKLYFRGFQAGILGDYDDLRQTKILLPKGGSILCEDNTEFHSLFRDFLNYLVPFLSRITLFFRDQISIG